MKSRILFVLSVFAFFSPFTAFAVGEGSSSSYGNKVLCQQAQLKKVQQPRATGSQQQSARASSAQSSGSAR